MCKGSIPVDQSIQLLVGGWEQESIFQLFFIFYQFAVFRITFGVSQVHRVMEENLTR